MYIIVSFVNIEAERDDNEQAEKMKSYKRDVMKLENDQTVIRS